MRIVESTLAGIELGCNFISGGEEGGAFGSDADWVGIPAWSLQLGSLSTSTSTFTVSKSLSCA